jgi:hypothetical protein
MAQIASVRIIESTESDQEILNFLKRQRMQGKIQLFLDRSPSFFSSLEVEGQKVKVMSLRHPETNQLMSLGCMAEKNYWINGRHQEEKIGYLSSLRTDPQFQSMGLLSKASQFLQAEHEANHPERIYLSTILEENALAKKILTAPRPGAPNYEDLGLLITGFFPVQKQIWNLHRVHTDGTKFQVRKATTADLPKFVEYWKKESAKRQLVPIYTESDILSKTGILRGLSVENIWLALDDQEIIGCLALWDQSAYRRWIVNSYATSIKLTKGLFNFFAPYLNRPKLPKENEPFNYRTASLVSIKNDDYRIFETLLHTLWKSQAKNENDLVIAIGFHEKDPLLKLVFPKMKQKLLSRLYLTHWPDDRSLAKILDRTQVPYVEFGSL